VKEGRQRNQGKGGDEKRKSDNLLFRDVALNEVGKIINKRKSVVRPIFYWYPRVVKLRGPVHEVISTIGLCLRP
jgi:hypothetical protein